MKNYFNAFVLMYNLGFSQSAPVTSEREKSDLRGPLLILTMEQYQASVMRRSRTQVYQVSTPLASLQ
jgi:hypothetical protein